jgi:hypothetical protein
MKKLGIALTLVVSLGLFAALAWACPWDGSYSGSPMEGRWGCYYGNPGPAPSGDYERFLDETADLRKDLAAKGAEYDALMARPDPDPTRTSTLSQEIFDLQNQLREKAQNYGISGMRHRRSYHSGPYPSGGWNCGAYCW